MFTVIIIIIIIISGKYLEYFSKNFHFSKHTGYEAREIRHCAFSIYVLQTNGNYWRHNGTSATYAYEQMDLQSEDIPPNWSMPPFCAGTCSCNTASRNYSLWLSLQLSAASEADGAEACFKQTALFWTLALTPGEACVRLQAKQAVVRQARPLSGYS